MKALTQGPASLSANLLADQEGCTVNDEACRFMSVHRAPHLTLYYNLLCIYVTGLCILKTMVCLLSKLLFDFFIGPRKCQLSSEATTGSDLRKLVIQIVYLVQPLCTKFKQI